jgi:hypothetical protein
MEMRYFWLLDGETQQYFKFYYQPGLENLVDYPSKHHTADIHQHINMSDHIMSVESATMTRGLPLRLDKRLF